VAFVSRILAVVASLLWIGQSVTASTAYSFPDPFSGTVSVTGNDGFGFQANIDIYVTALGYYDRDQDGLTLLHPVAIYEYDDLAITQLMMTTVGPGSFLSGLFRYNSITPFLLLAGHNYMVVGHHPGSDTEDFAANSPVPVSVASEILYQGYRFNFDSTLTFPTSNGDPATFFGPNFQFEAVPEPSTFALLGAGFILLLVGLYRLRRLGTEADRGQKG
jgi:hypothetical protein